MRRGTFKMRERGCQMRHFRAIAQDLAALPKNRRRKFPPFGFDAMELDFLCHAFQVSVFSNFVLVPRSPFGNRLLLLVAMCMIQSTCNFFYFFYFAKRGGIRWGKFFTPLKYAFLIHTFEFWCIEYVFQRRFPGENMRRKNLRATQIFPHMNKLVTYLNLNSRLETARSWGRAPCSWVSGGGRCIPMENSNCKIEIVFLNCGKWSNYKTRNFKRHSIFGGKLSF